MSEAGSAWATVPPTVPRWRTCGSPTSPAVWARIGHSALEQLREVGFLLVVRAPTATWSPPSRT